MIKATAAVTTAPDAPFSIRQVELEEPREKEVLVRIKGVGICHTDLTILSHGVYAPGVLGHEGAGVVEKVGSAVTRLTPGDHVVLSYYACHHCKQCHAGHPTYCEEMQISNASGGRADGSTPIYIDGKPAKGAFFFQSSFATHAIAHENNAVKVAKDLPIEKLGPLGCGFQTGAGAVLNALKVKQGEGIAIFGAGTVGLAAIMAAKAVGADPIIAVDLIPEKLEFARRLGATHTIVGNKTDAVAEIRSQSAGGVAYALECVGLPKLLEQALASLRPTGVCALLGLASPDAHASVHLLTLLQGRTLRGVIEGDSDPQTFIPELIELYRSGQFPFDLLIRTYALDEINTAVEDLKNGRTVKPVLRPF